jgi:hypothetical protein
MSPGQNWDSSKPSPAGEVLELSQFRRLEKKLSTLPKVTHSVQVPNVTHYVPVLKFIHYAGLLHNITPYVQFLM